MNKNLINIDPKNNETFRAIGRFCSERFGVLGKKWNMIPHHHKWGGRAPDDYPVKDGTIIIELDEKSDFDELKSFLTTTDAEIISSYSPIS